MRKTASILTWALVVATGGVAFGGTLHVPADFETLQEAVDAARSGDKIVVAAGRHYMTAEVRDKKRLRIEGEEGAILDGQGADVILGLAGCKNVRVSRLRLQHGQHGAIVTDSVGVSFKGCEVLEMSGEAVYVHRARKVSFADGHLQWVGVGVATEDTTNRVKVLRNRIEDCAQNAILVKGDRSVISGNAVRACGNDGIGVWGDRNKIVGNDVSECDDDGIEVWKAERNLFKRNVVRDVDEVGFQVENGRSNRFVGNQVEEARDCGFWIVESSDTFTKNVVTNCSPYGFEMVVGGNKLVRNEVSGSAEFDLFEHENLSPPNTYKRNTFGTTHLDAPP